MAGVGRRVLLVVAAMATASVAAAQDISGPLSNPDGGSLPAKPAKRATAHRAKPASTAKRTAGRASARLPAEAPAVPTADMGAVKRSAPVDPISFGMKWNGSNESAGQSRIDNLNGSATGTGAEVGMKLHF